MEEKKESFHYTYSAKQQEEIQSIRKKYLPQEDKMEQLRRLDRSVTRKGTVVSVIVGSSAACCWGSACAAPWSGCSGLSQGL